MHLSVAVKKFGCENMEDDEFRQNRRNLDEKLPAHVPNYQSTRKIPAENSGSTIERHKKYGSINNIAKSRRYSFPWKVHQMLEDVQKEGDTHIISWLPSGTYFKIHDRNQFMSKLVPIYFSQKSFKSFQRQLYLYGFVRLSGQDPERGAFYHPKFVRGKRQQVFEIMRQPQGKNKLKGSSPSDNNWTEGQKSESLHSQADSSQGGAFSQLGGSQDADQPTQSQSGFTMPSGSGSLLDSLTASLPQQSAGAPGLVASLVGLNSNKLSSQTELIRSTLLQKLQSPGAANSSADPSANFLNIQGSLNMGNSAGSWSQPQPPSSSLGLYNSQNLHVNYSAPSSSDSSEPVSLQKQMETLLSTAQASMLPSTSVSTSTNPSLMMPPPQSRTFGTTPERTVPTNFLLSLLQQQQQQQQQQSIQAQGQFQRQTQGYYGQVNSDDASLFFQSSNNQASSPVSSIPFQMFHQEQFPHHDSMSSSGESMRTLSNPFVSYRDAASTPVSATTTASGTEFLPPQRNQQKSPSPDDWLSRIEKTF